MNNTFKRPLFFRIFLHISCLFFCFSASYAQISFDDADLNGADGLLFSAGIQSGSILRKNLYAAVLDARPDAREALTETPRLLTCFPQKLESLQNGKFLQIRNTDGVFIYSVNSGTLTPISTTDSLYPSPAVFARFRSNLIETSISPDGNWICVCRKTDSVFASLVLASTKTGKEIVLIDRLGFSLSNIPVLWSPDSRVLIYEKNNRLYFIEPENAFDPALAEERFRSLGEGSIASIRWADEKKLIYIRDNSIFTIFSHELYTRSLYSAMLGTGKITGRLPLFFNDREDLFWADNSGTRLVIVQGGKNIFYFDLTDKSSAYNAAFFSLQSSPADFSVFWIPSNDEKSAVHTETANTIPLVWTEYFSVEGTRKSAAYVLSNVLPKSDSVSSVRFLARTLPEGAANPAMSPDNTKIAFCTEDALYVYNPRSWTAEHVFSDEKIVSFCWKNSSSLYAGGNESVRLWNLAENTKKVLFLSCAGDFMWASDGVSIISKIKAGNFLYSPDTNTWQPSDIEPGRSRQNMNSRWRIISENRVSGTYKNLFFVRSLKGPGKTLPLLADISDPKKAKGAVALAFEAFDNNESTACILDMLRGRGLSATFFINGEFLRRFPDTVQAIAADKHECVSSFYTTVDLLSDDFIIDENFIRRGLARNEDEFYALTQQDLKLLWYPPYGRFSEFIEKAGAAAGYKMIKNPIRPHTSGTPDGSSCTDVLSSESIARICADLKAGDVILLPCGGKGSCFSSRICDKIDVLINAVLESGYTLLPVSALVY